MSCGGLLLAFALPPTAAKRAYDTVPMSLKTLFVALATESFPNAAEKGGGGIKRGGGPVGTHTLGRILWARASRVRLLGGAGGGGAEGGLVLLVCG